jgi:hypothetical protein
MLAKLSIASSEYYSLSFGFPCWVCLFAVLETTWDLTRRKLARKGQLRIDEAAKVRAEKFSKTYSENRQNHKNYKPKQEPKDEHETKVLDGNDDNGNLMNNMHNRLMISR